MKCAHFGYVCVGVSGRRLNWGLQNRKHVLAEDSFICLGSQITQVMYTNFSKSDSKVETSIRVGAAHRKLIRISFDLPVFRSKVLNFCHLPFVSVEFYILSAKIKDRNNQDAYVCKDRV